MNRIFVLFFCLVTVSFTNAQIHEVGIFVGGSNFIGDVGKTNYISPNETAFGLLYKWNKSPYHSWRFSYTQARISGQDNTSTSPNRIARNYDFVNSVKEVSAGLEFNFFDFNLHGFDKKFTPYVYGGLSYFRYNSLYYVNGAALIDQKNYSVAIPMIIGIKSNITKNIILGFEVGARYTFADDIDGSNPKKNQFKSHKFGDLNSNDWYVFSGLTLTYTFGNKPCYCAD